MTEVLFVVTGTDHWTLTDGTEHPTGYWAEELAEPHRIFREAGFGITIATPGGVTPTVDRISLAAAGNNGDEQRARRMAEYLDTIATELEHPATLETVDVAGYDVVFVPGGHGPMEDLAASPAAGALLTAALDSGKILGVLCHAPAALLAAARPDGSWPFAGYRMTSLTNAEESVNDFAAKAPWLVEDRLRALGADFVAAAPWSAHVVADRTLYTGQNPFSSVELAKTLVAAVG
jgi:putative intracellular protease/amidase